MANLFTQAGVAGVVGGGESELEMTLDTIAINSIVPSPYQPRKAFPQKEIEELAESIKENSLAQPVLVRLVGHSFELVMGERRVLAYKHLGRKDIPAIIRELSNDEAARLALIENIQRVDLSPIEVAGSLNKLIGEFGYTQEEMAKQLGKGRSTITSLLNLLKLPGRIIELLNEGSISSSIGTVIQESDLLEKEKVDLADLAAKDSLSVRAVKALIAQIMRKRNESQVQKPKPVAPAWFDGVQAASESIKRSTGIGVKVKYQDKNDTFSVSITDVSLESTEDSQAAIGEFFDYLRSLKNDET
tara:strand:+ start:3754 stop:4659 length:906 start_codon:yes stop_codon:yes gene_type:complete